MYGSFLSGYSKGQSRRREEERKKTEDSIKKQQIKLNEMMLEEKAKQQEINAAIEKQLGPIALKNPKLAMILKMMSGGFQQAGGQTGGPVPGQLGGAQPGAAQAPGQPGGSGVINQLVRQYMGLQPERFQPITVPGPMGMERKRFETTGGRISDFPGGTVMDPRSREMIQQKSVSPGGLETTTPVLKYGQVAGEGRITKQPMMEEETWTEGNTTYKRWINKITKQPQSDWEIKAKKPQAAETAGKAAMMETGLADIDEFVKRITNPDGSYNRKLLFKAQWDRWGLTEGGEIRSLWRNALESKIRIESGAAVPESEVARLLQRFNIVSWTPTNVIKSRIRRMRDFLQRALVRIDQKDLGEYNPDDVVRVRDPKTNQWQFMHFQTGAKPKLLELKPRKIQKPFQRKSDPLGLR